MLLYELQQILVVLQSCLVTASPAIPMIYLIKFVDFIGSNFLRLKSSRCHENLSELGPDIKGTRQGTIVIGYYHSNFYRKTCVHS